MGKLKGSPYRPIVFRYGIIAANAVVCNFYTMMQMNIRSNVSCVTGRERCCPSAGWQLARRGTFRTYH